MSGSFDVITASVDDRNKTSPNSFTLYQNFPNPFNPATQISFYVPTAQSITIKLFDLLGNEVTTLVDGKISAGVHSVQFDGNRLSSGIYLYKLEAVDFVEVKKLVLIK